MADTQPPFNFEILLEPDLEGESELDDTLLNTELITDQFIGQSRIVGTVECVEYGTIDNKSGALVVLAFNYHAVKTYFREAIVLATHLGATNSIRYIAPDCKIWEISAGTTLTNEVGMGLQLGGGPYVAGNFGCTREKQYKSLHYMHFHGSGEKTNRALWTYEEKNAEPRNRMGIFSPFSVAMLIHVDGNFEFKFDIRGTVGWYERVKEGIRKVRAKKDKGTRVSLDGRTRIGKRPPGFVINDDLFKTNTST